VVVFPFAFHIAVQQPLKPLWSRLLLYIVLFTRWSVDEQDRTVHAARSHSSPGANTVCTPFWFRSITLIRRGGYRLVVAVGTSTQWLRRLC
jgi:hypothetical protein